MDAHLITLEEQVDRTNLELDELSMFIVDFIDYYYILLLILPVYDGENYNFALINGPGHFPASKFKLNSL